MRIRLSSRSSAALPIALASLLAASAVQAAVVVLNETTFDADPLFSNTYQNPLEPITDGRDSGYRGGSNTTPQGDTINGWTYYLEGGTDTGPGDKVITIDSGTIGVAVATMTESGLSAGGSPLGTKTRGTVTADVINLEYGANGTVSAIIQTFDSQPVGGGLFGEVTIDITMLRAERSGKGLAWLDGTGTNFADFDFPIPNADNASYTFSFTPTQPQFQIGFFSGVNADTNASINSIKVSSEAAVSTLALTIARSGANLDFTWDSQAGMLYNLKSSNDLTLDFASWTLVEGDIPATAPLNAKSIPKPADPFLFYIVEEYPAPPLTVLSENFDGTSPGSLPAGWAAGKNDPPDTASTTYWELGTPANFGPVPPGVPLPSAANCVGTNISGNYDDPVADDAVPYTDIWLRTPAIDLGAATGGTLAFQQWTEIEQFPGDLDYGSIRILDASDDSELAVMEYRTIDGSTTGWEQYSMALPAAAFTAAAGTIKVEFRFEADDIDSFAGWYIDDVVVTVPAS